MNDNLIKCFEDTLRFCESAELKQETESAIASSRIYFEGFTAESIKKSKKAEITVENTTTFAAAKEYQAFGKVAVLNFANPEIPGGGVKKGSKAQEECLCRCSNLYPCLTAPTVYDDFYRYHNRYGRFFYSDRIIYSSNVTVFKGEDLKMLDREQRFNVDVLTCAAPFVAKLKYTNEAVLYDLFKSRINNIINSAIDNCVDVLILGAFGCGAFKNPPGIVAKAFKAVIEENHYDECFDKIVFAIKSSNNDDPFEPCPNLMAFECEFIGLSSELSKLRFSGSWSIAQTIGTITLPSGRILRSGAEFNPYTEWKSGNIFNSKQFSILGDSISTLEGYNPHGYNLFFTGEVCQKTGVSEMDDTWWGQVINYCGGELLVNNSWSGSRVTQLPNRDCLFPSGCSDERTNGLHIGSVKPDVIIVYLGTNDWARGVEAATRDCADFVGRMWSSVFESAYDKMLEKLKNNYPDAEIFCCTLCSTYMSGNPSFVFSENYGGVNIEKYNIVIRNIAESRNCKVIDLYKYHLPYDSVDGSHPNRDGMCRLATIMLREMLDDIGANFLDCKNDEHDFVPIGESENKKYVCQKCGKMNIVNTSCEGKKGNFDLESNASEYVFSKTNTTVRFYDNILLLSVVNANVDMKYQKDIVVVGSDDGCDLKINKNGIAGKHAEFCFESEIWYLRDNFSENGTWLNGLRIQPGKKYQLAENDEINFANKETVIFYKHTDLSDKSVNDDAEIVSILETSIQKFMQSQRNDSDAFSTIFNTLCFAPLYIPVEIDDAGIFNSIDPANLKPGDIIKNDKQIKMRIAEVIFNDRIEMIPMFTSKDEANKGNPKSLIRYYPADYLPMLINIGKVAIINPFSENHLILPCNFISVLYGRICNERKQSNEMPDYLESENLIGKIIGGKYTVLKKIDTGGYCNIFLVSDIRINKLWAMKTYKTHRDVTGLRNMFLTEANMTLGLNHPVIPMTVDVIEENDNLYIIREYIEGETLETLVSTYGAQPMNLVVGWAKQLCDALRYLHSKNYVYRDMKPANVILKPDGTVKIKDFEIMCTYEPERAGDTACLGTKGYAAPEGVILADSRADIFGLGMTMYRLVTGIDPAKPPYEINPICEINPLLPKGLEYIISKCTKPNPNDRYQNCDELMADLNNYMNLPRRKGFFEKLFGG